LITSKQIITVGEEWNKYFKSGKYSTDIYLNPTSSDMKELYSKIDSSINPKKEVRFIADARKHDVYVWDAGFANHSDVGKSYGFHRQTFFDEPPYVFDGFGLLSRGKIVGEFYGGTAVNLIQALGFLVVKQKGSLQSDALIKEIRPFFKYDWTFIDRYVSGISQKIEQQKVIFMSWINK
jgi:hypothetical protein